MRRSQRNSMTDSGGEERRGGERRVIIKAREIKYKSEIIAFSR